MAGLFDWLRRALPGGSGGPAPAAKPAPRRKRRDERFGTLWEDDHHESWDGEADWDGVGIDLSLEAATDEELDDALRTAHALWDQQDLWGERLESFAVQELLPLKNDFWLADGERPLTEEQFRRRMALSSITILPGGKFIFWYYDGELFLDHAIEITGNLVDGPTGADIS